jgi:WD40 repeat protein
MNSAEPADAHHNDSSSDDDGASQTTEDDPQVPENPAPAMPPPVPTMLNSSARGRPHYQLKHTVPGHAQSISALKFSPDGTLLASCGSWINQGANTLAPRLFFAQVLRKWSRYGPQQQES